MSLEDVLGDIREIPPMRPVRKGKDIRLVYPFYMHSEADGVAENRAYNVELVVDASGHEIIFRKTQTKKPFKIPVETPDFIVATSLGTLYRLAGGAGSGPPRGLLSCRDPFRVSSGSSMRGHLVAVIFDGEPTGEPTIYLVGGTARLVRGSCWQGSKPAYKGFNITILYVTGSSESRSKGCPASLASISGAPSVRIVIEDHTRRTGSVVELESDSLYCYPVYPPSEARGNKFYPATVVAIISPAEHMGLGYGAVFELLVGTTFASMGASAWDLLSSSRVKYPQTHFIPSPALLSSSPGQRWYEKALTLRAQDAPLLRVKLDGGQSGKRNTVVKRVCDIVKAQILQSLGPKSPLAASGVFKLNTDSGLIVIPQDKLKEIIDKIKELGFRDGAWRDLVDGLQDALQAQGDGIGIFQWSNLWGSPPDVHVDPKLVAKALVNELVAYPLLRQALNDQDVRDKVFAKIVAIRYRRIATIGEPIADLLVGRTGTASEVLYVHAWMNFVPIRLLATMYWALSSIAGPPQQSQGRQRVLRDTGLLLLSWGLMAAAFAWKYRGGNRRDSSFWHPFLLYRLSSSIGAFAVLAGIHGLAHIASQAMADSFGISRPDLYMRELTRLYLNDQNLLKIRYQPDKTALLIDGALLVSPASFLTGDLSVAVAMEGLYHAVREQSFLNGLGDLCNELRRSTGPYNDGVCMNVWRLSNRSYLAIGQTVSKSLKNVADYILSPFDLADSSMSEAYYPPSETIVYLIEKFAQEKKLQSSEVKAYASQLAKAKLPLCYDACEMCVMSDECPLISSPVQQQLVSRTGAHLLCIASGH